MIKDQLAALAALPPAVLSGGIAFLYDLTDELLQARQAGAEPGEVGGNRPTAQMAAIDEAVALGHVPNLSHVDHAVLSELEGDIRDLRDLLRPYRKGELPVEPGNARLIERIARLRIALQAIYGQRIEFHGEDHESIPSPLMALDVVIGLVRAVTIIGVEVRSIDINDDHTIGIRTIR
jgi:hypothetical protein